MSTKVRKPGEGETIVPKNPREDLASLIVTNPDIVDEGIDISGLRTTTDTNPLLLANLEPGIKFDPTQQSVYSDLLNYFSGGLPVIETPTASNVDIPLPGGDDSGGGGSVSTRVGKPGDTVTIVPINPGTFTAESLDQSFAGEEVPIVTQPGREAPITVQDMGDGRTTTIPGRPKIMDQPGVTTLSSPEIPQGFEGYYGANQTVTAEDTPESFIEKIKGFAQGALDNVDIGKAIAMTALNAAVGKPVSIAFNILAALLPKENPINKFNNQYAVGGDLYKDIIQDSTDPQGLEKRLIDYSDSLKAGNLPNQDPFGKNTTSGFGDYTKMATEIATEKLNKIRSGESLSQFEKDQLEYYGRVSGLTGKTNIPGTPLMVGGGEKTSQDLINEARQDYFSSIDTGVDDFITAIPPDEDFGKITTVPTGPTLGGSFPGMGGIRTTGPVLGESFPGIGVGYETVDDLDEIEGQESSAGNIMTDASIVDQPISISSPTAKGPPGQLNPANPSDRKTIIEKAQELGVGNIEQHFKNNTKLRQAQQAGLISQEDYNILGGYDVTQNITGGSTAASAALNAIVGTGRNIAEAIMGEQDFGIIPGTTVRNTQGGLGLISQDQKNIHNAIVNGNLDTPEGIAAVKNQIEISRFRDPIMDMVQQPDTGTLAGEPDLPGIGGEADIDLIGEPDIVDTPISDMPDDAGMPEAPTPDIPDRGRGEIAPTPPSLDIPDRGRGTIPPSPPPRDDDAGMPEAPTPSPGFTAPTKPGQSPRGGGGGGGDSGGGGGGRGCVIATHAVNSGAFTADTKREAIRWCVKNLHKTWWGEAIRRGYRYYGQKAIDEGKAKNHYQEFKDYVAFGTGKRRTLKTAWTFTYRTVQFFVKGLFSAKR